MIMRLNGFHFPGLAHIENKLCTHHNWGADVLHQSWPKVDPEYLQPPDVVEMSVLVRVFHLFSVGSINAL